MVTSLLTSFVYLIFCRGSNLYNFSKNGKHKEDNMYESSLENTPDSQSMPFIDNSHRNSPMIQMPHIFNHGEAKTFSEKIMPSKQPSTKETCRCNIKNVQRSSNLEFHGYDNKFALFELIK